MSPDKKIVIIAGPNGARARRRLRNFHRVYKPLADVWRHFDNADDEAELIDWSER